MFFSFFLRFVRGLGKSCSGVLRKGFHPLRQSISLAAQNLTQSYDYLFNGLNGQQSFSTLVRTQGFFSPILKGNAIRKIYICKQKAPITEHLLTKTKHHLLNKSSIFAKNPQATPYEKGEIITNIGYSFPSFGYPIVVKSLS